MEDMWDLRIGAEILTAGSMESIGICMGKASKICVMSNLEGGIRTGFRYAKLMRDKK